MGMVLQGYFRIVQEDHQKGKKGDVIQYPLHLGNEYVKLGILSMCDELGELITAEQQLDHTITAEWPPVEGE